MYNKIKCVSHIKKLPKHLDFYIEIHCFCQKKIKKQKKNNGNKKYGVKEQHLVIISNYNISIKLCFRDA